jgi:excisionase family DNA binding protein
MQFSIEQDDINKIADVVVDRVLDVLAERMLPKSETIKMDSEYLNVEELSQILKCKHQRIYDLKYKGEIPHHKYGKKLFFKKSEIKLWFESQLNYVPAKAA